MNRDPIGENGGINVYGMLGNDFLNFVDLLGLACVLGEKEFISGQMELYLYGDSPDKTGKRDVNKRFMRGYYNTVQALDVANGIATGKVAEKIISAGLYVGGRKYPSAMDAADKAASNYKANASPWSYRIRINYQECVCEKKKTVWKDKYAPWVDSGDDIAGDKNEAAKGAELELKDLIEEWLEDNDT